MGESGDSGQISWGLELVVERLGLEAWRRGDWEEMQLGTCQIKTGTVETVKTMFSNSLCAVSIPEEWIWFLFH